MLKSSLRVLFNASVVLAGFKSPKGGSGKILSWVKKKKIKGLISEIILDEVLRNASRIGFSDEELDNRVKTIFNHINKEPKQKNVEQFKKVVLDFGDAHVLASAKESQVDFLVTLDKKHLLILQDKIKTFKIVTPGQLIRVENAGGSSDNINSPA